MATLELINVKLTNRSSESLLRIPSGPDIPKYPATVHVNSVNIQSLLPGSMSSYFWALTKGGRIQGDFPAINCYFQYGSEDTVLELVRSDTKDIAATFERRYFVTSNKALDTTLTLCNEYIQNGSAEEDLHIPNDEGGPSAGQLIPRAPHWLHVQHAKIKYLQRDDVSVNNWVVVENAETGNGACIFQPTDEQNALYLIKQNWTGQVVATFKSELHEE